MGLDIDDPEIAIVVSNSIPKTFYFVTTDLDAIEKNLSSPGLEKSRLSPKGQGNAIRKTFSSFNLALLNSSTARSSFRATLECSKYGRFVLVEEIC